MMMAPTNIVVSKVVVSKAHKTLAVRHTNELAGVFAHAKEFTLNSNKWLAVPHKLDETTAFRNMGYTVEAPITAHYDWPGPNVPFAIQKKTCDMMTTNKRGYVLNGLGTGKTSAALWSWDWLNKTGDACKLLIVSTVSTLFRTWRKEIFMLLPERKCAVLSGTREKRLRLLADKSNDIYIVNHDGLMVVMKQLMERKDINCMCIDELAVYRNGQAERTKNCKIVAEKMKWVWGMTGGPTPNEPTDVWAQAKIITPHTVPKFFGRFREELMYKATPFQFKPKEGAIERAHQALQPSVRFTLDEVTELPELVERVIDVPMGKRQGEIYKKIRDNAVAMLLEGTISAVNAGVVFNKLLQISCGWVYLSPPKVTIGVTQKVIIGVTHKQNANRVVVNLDNQARLDALVEAIHNTEHKVIVFVPYIHAMQGIAECLIKNNIDNATVSGSTPVGERNKIFTLFQDTKKVRVIVAHPQCMAHGLTLTAADTIIWFSPTTSLEIFDQANARIRRVGQKHKQLVLMLQSTAEERRVYARLRSKQKMQADLLGLFEDHPDYRSMKYNIVEPKEDAMNMAVTVNPSQSVIPQSTSPNFEKRTGQYVALRDLIKNEDDAHKERMKPKRAMLDKLNNDLLNALNMVKTDSASNAYGTVYRSEQVSATLADPDAFMRHVISAQSWELLDKKANKTAVKAYVEDTGVPPPGVNYNVNLVVGVRRK